MSFFTSREQEVLAREGLIKVDINPQKPNRKGRTVNGELIRRANISKALVGNKNARKKPMRRGRILFR